MVITVEAFISAGSGEGTRLSNNIRPAAPPLFPHLRSSRRSYARGLDTILRDGVPMLLVRGKMSDLVRQESADEFLARFPQVEFTDVRGAGHLVAGDRNDIFAGAVLDFLARRVDAG